VKEILGKALQLQLENDESTLEDTQLDYSTMSF
jgi:hypothetical protein